jgi:hypothetical protein
LPEKFLVSFTVKTALVLFGQSENNCIINNNINNKVSAILDQTFSNSELTAEVLLNQKD